MIKTIIKELKQIPYPSKFSDLPEWGVYGKRDDPAMQFIGHATVFAGEEMIICFAPGMFSNDNSLTYMLFDNITKENSTFKYIRPTEPGEGVTITL